MDVAFYNGEGILVSWSISYKNLHDFIHEVPEFKSGDAPEDQLNVARSAARNIIDSQVIGSLNYDFRVSLSGHSNPNHQPAPGMAGDGMGVNVYQFTPVVAPAETGS